MPNQLRNKNSCAESNIQGPWWVVWAALSLLGAESDWDMTDLRDAEFNHMNRGECSRKSKKLGTKSQLSGFTVGTFTQE